MFKVAVYLISDGIGGAEQIVWQTLNYFKKNDSIFLIVNSEIAAFYTDLLPENRILNIGRIFLHSRLKSRLLRFLIKNKFYNYLSMIIRVKSKNVGSFLSENGIRIIHSHLEYALYSSLVIKKNQKNIKVIYTAHGAFGFTDDKKLAPCLPLSLIDFKSVDSLTFVSNYMYNLYKSKKIPFSDYKIIYNGIDHSITDNFNRPEKKTKDFRILYVGGSKYVKGYDILVDTVALLLISTPEYRFKVVVLGPLADNNKFAIMIRQRGLDQYFEMVGFINPPGHIEYFKSADFLFMPSRSESLPVAALEALSLDLPVIASNVGGLPEVIKDGYNGFLANPDPGEFIFKIKEMINNYNKYAFLTRETNRELRIKFDAVNMSKMYLNLYRNII